ncbi:hypothetical protein [Microbacterium sp. NIBRBAC000506063]|uniref:hypothetical protein n=1 Tax=Microbacterium sp. NIBRBAC000506063 TaxID=2734618 RepID=UPI001BB71E1D|nr:hypothetical protein [Microbacterium sp. NIBRBAC000506063]QTV80175.1 hypothetical protein KAE78_03725 [Microbacterium sp. NIBRBAC000506063]
MALLLGLLTWDRIFAVDARCHDLQSFVAAGDDGCAVGAVLAASPFEAALFGVAVGVLMVATFFTAVPTARSLGWIRAGRIAGLPCSCWRSRPSWPTRSRPSPTPPGSRPHPLPTWRCSWGCSSSRRRSSRS